MKISPKAQAKTKQAIPACTITEYLIEGEKHINNALVSLKGRYPERGVAFNEICKEIAYVTEGEGELVINGATIALKSGDVVLIQPGEHYFWEGHMTLLLSCTPAWYLEQHKWIESSDTTSQINS